MTQRPVVLVCDVCRREKGKQHKLSCPASKSSKYIPIWVDKFTNRQVQDTDGI